MQIIINQADLLSAITIAQKAVSASNMQILSGILLIAEDQKLTLMTTDFDISIETSIPCTVKEEGSLVLESSIFGNIVRRLPPRPLSIEKKEGQVKIKSKDIVFDLASLDASEFPAMPLVEGDDQLVLEEEDLSDYIDYTIFSTSVDDTRPSLMGVLIESTGEEVNFVSLDGYRLSRVRLDQEAGKMRVIVPAKSLSELRKILKDGGDVKVKTDGKQILFDFASTKFYSRLLEGSFVDYKQLLNTSLSKEAKIDRKSLVNALERVSLLATEDKARLVKMNFSQDTIEFKSNSEIGRGYEKIMADYKDEDLMIAFNNRYILDGVKAIKTDEIDMTLESPVSPAILRPRAEDAVDYSYLVLPVKLKSDN